MNRSEFTERFRDLTNEPDPYGIRNVRGLNAAGIRRAETDLGAEFPADYTWFLQHYWTGIFGSADLYALDPDDRSYIGVRQPRDEAERFVAIADDGCGNAYCFPVNDAVCRDEIVIVPLLASEFTGNVEFRGVLDFLARNG